MKRTFHLPNVLVATAFAMSACASTAQPEVGTGRIIECESGPERFV